MTATSGENKFLITSRGVDEIKTNHRMMNTLAMSAGPEENKVLAPSSSYNSSMDLSVENSFSFSVPASTTVQAMLAINEENRVLVISSNRVMILSPTTFLMLPPPSSPAVQCKP